MRTVSTRSPQNNNPVSAKFGGSKTPNNYVPSIISRPHSIRFRQDLRQEVEHLPAQTLRHLRVHLLLPEQARPLVRCPNAPSPKDGSRLALCQTASPRSGLCRPSHVIPLVSHPSCQQPALCRRQTPPSLPP